MKIAYKAKSRKHATKIIKHLASIGTNKAGITNRYVGEYYWLDECKDLSCTPDLPDGYKSGKLPSAPSKKDLQEALSKVGEELSSMNERLGKLEAKSEPKTANGIEIHFDEVTEGLPEKWCVSLRNVDEKLFLNWVNSAKTVLYDYKYDIGSNMIFHFPQLPFGHLASTAASGYTEITFETFKKYVLKEEVNPQPEIDFSKAGQLVKSDDVIVITDGNHTSEMFSGMRLFSHVHYSDYWDKEKFTLCTEPVTLQN